MRLSTSCLFMKQVIRLKILFLNIFKKHLSKEKGVLGIGASIFVNWYYFKNFIVTGKNSVSENVVD